jgi:hypothetical protein
MYLTTFLKLYLSFYFIYDSWLCIRFIGVELMASCIKVTFRSIHDDPMARDRLLGKARHSCRLR